MRAFEAECERDAKALLRSKTPTRRAVPRLAFVTLLALGAGCGVPAEGDDDTGVAPRDARSADARDDEALDDASDDASDAVALEELGEDALVDVGLDEDAGLLGDGDARAEGGAIDAALRDVRGDVLVDVRGDVRGDVLVDVLGDVRNDGASDARSDAGLDGSAGTLRCPEGMVLVDGRVCVDRWEAAVEEIGLDGGVAPWSPYRAVDGRRVRAFSRADTVPQGYISGSQAAAACREAGKRLCLRAEWQSACQGPSRRTYPYGSRFVTGACNVGRRPHPLIEFYGRSDSSIYTYDNMNNPGINMLPNSLARTGQFDQCVSEWGVFDMHGNLHEWVAETDGTFKGGFYADVDTNGAGCLYTTTAHGYTYHDYSTGFRCCADPVASP